MVERTWMLEDLLTQKILTEHGLAAFEFLPEQF